jgi:hypothetical protein
MNLAELQAAVIALTNRPDLTALTLSAVQSATLKAHQSDYFPRDIYETGLSFFQPEYEHDFEVFTFIPRFRAVKYARVYDNANSTPGVFFELIDPANVLDSYNTARTNVMYLGGTEIHFKALAQFQYMLFGCYLNPDIASGTFTSWIADYHFDAIVYEAAAIIFRSTGNLEKFRSMRELVSEQYQLLKINNVLAAGF